MTGRAMLPLLLLLSGCQSPPPASEIDGAAALGYARAQVEFGPRVPGSEGHRKAAAWLDSLLRTRADTVIAQAWSHVAHGGDTLALTNLLARFNPTAERRLLFLAHWDTRPRADADTGASMTRPIDGANDGASGVAVLLAMADALVKAPPVIGVDLLLVDAEDFGTFPDTDVLLGSKYYAANLPSGPKPEYAVLLDMVGAKGSIFRKEGYSVTAAPEVVDLVWKTAGRMGHDELFVDETGISVTDDHIPLQQAGIRAIDVIAEFGRGYSFPYWHTADDTIDKLSAEVLGAVGDVMMGVIRQAKKIK